MRIGFGTLLAGVIVLGAGVGVGLAAYQSGQQSAQAAAVAAVNSAAQTTGGQASQQRAAPAMGVVASIGDKEFSLKPDSNANPITVKVGEQTAIRKQAAGTIADIKAGERITVRGDAQSDGSIAASAVQLVGADGAIVASGQQGQNQMRIQRGPAGASSGGQGQASTQQGPAGAGSTGSGGPFMSGGRSQGGPGMLVGTVKDITGNVVTLTRPGAQGASDTEVKVSLSDQTTVTKTVAGEFKDIVVGAYVVAIGPLGADGVLTAASIQLMPADAARSMNAPQ